MRSVQATRYVLPLREGGSLPAIVEADDDGLYVVKFRGAGQGQRALVAELVAGEVGRLLGLPIPELVLVELDPLLARLEPDQEVQELVAASGGTNLGLDYLPGAFDFSPIVLPAPDPLLASRIVLFDAYVTNVDRTARNPNMLLWHRALYLIDQGASLYIHYSWADYLRRAADPFSRISEHVLLPFAAQLEEAAKSFGLLDRERLRAVVDQIPSSWLGDEAAFATLERHREGYVAYLDGRLEARQKFIEEAIYARARLV